MRVLSSDDVAELVTIDDVIDSVEEAYRQLASGEATDAPRENVRAAGLDGNLKAMPAAGPSGLGGYLYTGGFDRPDGTVSKLAIVFGEEHGHLKSVIEIDRLSWLRTGATSGVATRHCAREDASTLGVVGAGKQARSQLLAVAAVRDVEEARVFSPTPENRRAFAAEMSEATDVDVAAVDTARAAVEDRDVVCTATTSPEPVLEGDWLSPGTHLNAIGAHYPDEREVDDRTVERSTVIPDSLARAKKEEGELIIPAERGEFDWADATELADVVSGAAPGRSDPDEITYMTSGGLSIEVLVPARDVFERAADREVGTVVEFDGDLPLV